VAGTQSLGCQETVKKETCDVPVHFQRAITDVLIWSEELASVVQKLDSTIHRINLYPVGNAIDFPNTYPLDSDLSGG